MNKAEFSSSLLRAISNRTFVSFSGIRSVTHIAATSPGRRNGNPCITRLCSPCHTPWRPPHLVKPPNDLTRSQHETSAWQVSRRKLLCWI